MFACVHLDTSTPTLWRIDHHGLIYNKLRLYHRGQLFSIMQKTHHLTSVEFAYQIFSVYYTLLHNVGFNLSCCKFLNSHLVKSEITHTYGRIDEIYHIAFRSRWFKPIITTVPTCTHQLPTGNHRPMSLWYTA